MRVAPVVGVTRYEYLFNPVLSGDRLLARKDCSVSGQENLSLLVDTDWCKLIRFRIVAFPDRNCDCDCNCNSCISISICCGSGSGSNVAVSIGIRICCGSGSGSVSCSGSGSSSSSCWYWYRY